jgi:hypothetical protein
MGPHASATGRWGLMQAAGSGGVAKPKMEALMTTMPVSKEPSSHASRLLPELAARPVAVVFSAICVVLFMLHERSVIKMDGYGLLLLALAVVPWSIPVFGKLADAIGHALGNANIKSFEIAGLKVEIEQLEKKIDDQRRILDNLIVFSMAFYIYDKLKFLALGAENPGGQFAEYKYVKDEPFDHDLRFLRDHGYLAHFQISELAPGQNLVGRLRVTEMGKEFVKLKESRGLGALVPGK